MLPATGKHFQLVWRICTLRRRAFSVMPWGMTRLTHSGGRGVADLSLAARKRSLPELAEERILQGIRRGCWKDFLPGETTLAGLLQVSRETVRASLDRLEAQKMVLRQKGRRTRILRHGKSSPAPSRIIRILTPQRVQEFTPFMYEWHLSYQALMRHRGFEVELDVFPKIFQRFSARELSRHVASLPARAWIPHIASHAMQEWFQKDCGLPVILAGSPHEGISLPFVDVHFEAAARHAVGLLARAGHRSLLVVTSAKHFAGDSAAIKGIRTAMRQSGGLTCDILEYTDEPDHLFRSLAPRLRGPDPPTALLICHQWIIPGIYSVLNHLSLRIPERISLVCLHYAPFMAYLTPSLAHYLAIPDQFAKKLADLTFSLIQRGRIVHQTNWLIPEFVPGKSIAERNTP